MINYISKIKIDLRGNFERNKAGLHKGGLEMGKPYRNMQEKLKKLTYDYITTESEVFTGVGYVAKNGEMAILAGPNGSLALSMKNIPEFCKELMDFYEVYADNNRIVRNQLENVGGKYRKRRKVKQ